MSDAFSVHLEAYQTNEYSEYSIGYAVLRISREELEEMANILRVMDEYSLIESVVRIGETCFYTDPVEGCDVYLGPQGDRESLLGCSGELCDEDDFVELQDILVNINPNGSFNVFGHGGYSGDKAFTASLRIDTLKKCIDMTVEDAARYLGDKDNLLQGRAASLLKGVTACQTT